MLALTSVHPCLHPYPNPSVPAAVEIPVRQTLHNGLRPQGPMSTHYTTGHCSSLARIPSHLQGKNTTQDYPYHSTQGVTNFMTRYDLTPMSRPLVGHRQTMVRVAHIQHIPHGVGHPSDRSDFVYHAGHASQVHASLPPFSMFSSSLAKETSRALMQSKKSGLEVAAAAPRFNRIPQRGGVHSSFVDFSKSTKQTRSTQNMRRKRYQRRDVGFCEMPNGMPNNDLSHSIASILSEGSDIPVHQNSTINKQSFPQSNGSARHRKKSSDAYDSDAQSDVDVTSCSSDELEFESKASDNVDENEHFEIERNDDVMINLADESSLTPVDGSETENQPAGENFTENTQRCSATPGQDLKVYLRKSLSGDQLAVESQNLVKAEVDCDISLGAGDGGVSPDNINHASRSSANFNTEKLTPVQKVCHEADGRMCHQADGRMCHQADGRMCHQADGRMCHQADGRMCHQADGRMDVQERSAFKPISKHGPDTPLMCGSFPQKQVINGGHAPCPCVTCVNNAVFPCVTCANITFRNGQTDRRNCNEIKIKERVIEVDFDEGSSTQEKGSPADAISTLRHKSCIYQHKVVIGQTQDAGAAALTESLGAWFDWLRNKDATSQTSNLSHLEALSPRMPPPPRYFCEACNKTYSTFGGLSKHRQFHCSEHVRKEFACKVCSKSYSSLGALKMHIRTHTLPCKCQVCGKAFSRPWLLQGHVRTHTGEKPFRCSHCGRAFADRSNLRAHLQTHADVKKYACKNCGKTFSRMSLLSKHSEGSCPGNSKV